jgi:hypothetical protein
MIEIFYAICGIFFSVGISQVIAFDLSKIADKENYLNMSKSLEKVKISFLIHFILSSVAFIIFQMLQTNNFDLKKICIKRLCNSYETFFMLIIICSVVFLAYNFLLLTNKKTKLDKVYRDEAFDD